MSTPVEKGDIFGNLRHVLIFWIYSGLNRLSVIGTGGSAGKSLFSNMSLRIFAYFHHFTIFSHFEQIRNLSFRLKINTANTKTPKTMLSEYIASALSGHAG